MFDLLDTDELESILLGQRVDAVLLLTDELTAHVEAALADLAQQGAATDAVAGLEHCDRQPSTSEVASRAQPGQPRPYHDDIDVLRFCFRHLSNLRGRGLFAALAGVKSIRQRRSLSTMPGITKPTTSTPIKTMVIVFGIPSTTMLYTRASRNRPQAMTANHSARFRSSSR